MIDSVYQLDYYQYYIFMKPKKLFPKVVRAALSIERATMLKYGINNIKLMYESDLDVLGQIDHYE